MPSFLVAPPATAADAAALRRGQEGMPCEVPMDLGGLDEVHEKALEQMSASSSVSTSSSAYTTVTRASSELEEHEEHEDVEEEEERTISASPHLARALGSGVHAPGRVATRSGPSVVIATSPTSAEEGGEGLEEERDRASPFSHYAPGEHAAYHHGRKGRPGCGHEHVDALAHQHELVDGEEEDGDPITSDEDGEEAGGEDEVLFPHHLGAPGERVPSISGGYGEGYDADRAHAAQTSSWHYAGACAMDEGPDQEHEPIDEDEDQDSIAVAPPFNPGPTITLLQGQLKTTFSLLTQERNLSHHLTRTLTRSQEHLAQLHACLRAKTSALHKAEHQQALLLEALEAVSVENRQARLELQAMHARLGGEEARVRQALAAGAEGLRLLQGAGHLVQSLLLTRPPGGGGHGDATSGDGARSPHDPHAAADDDEVLDDAGEEEVLRPAC